MKIAITTPTGHVGSAAADFLLDVGGDVSVKLLGRRPEKLRRFAQRGAEMWIGSQDDVDFLTKATRDVDALFWVTPPGFGSDKVRDFQNRLGKAVASAVRTNHVSRVVNLSSIGAHLDAGVGPINGLHDVEELLNGATNNITHLRPGFFFENLLWQADSIRNEGRFSLPLSGSQRFAMIAARDIGAVAAQRLMDRQWTGICVRELHGSADLTFDDVAATLSRVLGRKIVYTRCDPQEIRQILIDNAVSENVADMMLEMYEAAETGRLRPTQPRSGETTTPTTLLEFIHEAMLPVMAAPASR